MMNVRMKRELTSLIKTPIERRWCNGLRCFSSVSSNWKGVIPTLLQPRVLLYDAVSLFCHRGIHSSQSLLSIHFMGFRVSCDPTRGVCFCSLAALVRIKIPPFVLGILLEHENLGKINISNVQEN